MPNRIDALFTQARANQRTVFIPFLTAGDPTVETTALVAERIGRLCESKKVPTLIEIGFPFSDPIADGPTIQTSYTRVLSRKITVDQIFALIESLRKNLAAPLVGMVSYTLVLRRGLDEFLLAAARVGLDGLIIPDLPMEEAEGLLPRFDEHGLKLIQLIAPTTPPVRAQRIIRLSQGFLYGISVTGITGERNELPATLLDRLKSLRSASSIPLCVGFGISKPEQIRMLRDHVDGIIVGSVIVREVSEIKANDPSSLTRFDHFIEGLIKPLT